MKNEQPTKEGLIFGGFIFVLLVILFLLNSCTPVKYVYVDPQDSVIKKQRVIYDNIYTPSPFIFNYGWGFPYPLYRPVIIQRHRPIVVPHRPTPHYPQRLQRPVTPWRVPRRN